MRTIAFLAGVIIYLSSPAITSGNPTQASGIERLGAVHFPTSCSPKVQSSFEHAVLLLHSFWYEEASKEFGDISRRDPKCAMAYWGIGMSAWHQLADFPGADETRIAQAALLRAGSLAEITTEREREYIHAINLFYLESGSSDPLQRAAAYSTAMASLYRKYPNDREAAAFYGLSLLASEPDNDATLVNRKKAATVLEKLFAEQPDHPGAAHYLIHVYDRPQLAQLGLPAARRYARIASSAPHALHMPSHIFARLGLWQEDIDSNLASIAATQKVQAMHMEGAAHKFHAMDYLIYAYLQCGREVDAAQVIAEVQRMPEDAGYVWGGIDWRLYSQAEFPAVYDLELRRWSEAAKLQPPLGAPPIAVAIVYWAQGVGAARSGDAAGAKRAADRIATIREGMRAASQAFFADSINDLQREASAWADYADGRTDRATEALRSISEREEAIGPERPAILIPAREMLADMMLEGKKADRALVEYEMALKFNPNRFNSLYGAAVASEVLGNVHQSAVYYARLLGVSAGSPSERPELSIAKKRAINN